MPLPRALRKRSSPPSCGQPQARLAVPLPAARIRTRARRRAAPCRDRRAASRRRARASRAGRPRRAASASRRASLRSAPCRPFDCEKFAQQLLAPASFFAKCRAARARLSLHCGNFCSSSGAMRRRMKLRVKRFVGVALVLDPVEPRARARRLRSSLARHAEERAPERLAAEARARRHAARAARAGAAQQVHAAPSRPGRRGGARARAHRLQLR